jgi:hypothetical protein
MCLARRSYFNSHTIGRWNDGGGNRLVAKSFRAYRAEPFKFGEDEPYPKD